MIKKKSLGQHFLHSKKVLSDIVTSSNISKDTNVLEIGPGEGVLTRELLDVSDKVYVVEKDDRLIPKLQEKFSKEISSGHLKIFHEDVLKIDIEKILGQRPKYKVVANIPYYITGQIIRMFLENKNQPTDMTLLVQKEVADRVVARDKKESLLSLSVKIFGEPSISRTVGKGAFNPPPTVDSAVLHIKNISRNNLEKKQEETFFKIIHAGFAHKRKQLAANLSNIYPKDFVIKILEKSKLNPSVRAEDLDLNNWITLCNEIYLYEKNN